MQATLEVPRWETEISSLLDDLAAAQSDLLSVLEEKRAALMAVDAARLAALQEREEAVLEQLASCQQRRADLLEQAGPPGDPSPTLGKLAEKLPAGGRNPLSRRVTEMGLKMQLLRNQSLTNWVLAQQSLLHVAQMLEIIATGGRLQPTYGKGESPHNRGALVDEAA